MVFFVRVNAKVNLFLKVMGKRRDGYHDIVSVMQSIGVSDEMFFEKIRSKGVEFICSSKEVPLDGSNIVMAALELLSVDYPGRVGGLRVDLRKSIPVRAGLGGGSADAAGMLVGLNELFELGLSEGELMEYGGKLGMDVPFFVRGGVARARERGDVLEWLENKRSYWLVLVNPGFGVATRKAYEMLKREDMEKGPENEEGILGALEAGDVEGIGRMLYNSFERPVMRKYPVLREVKEDIVGSGCLGAVLSGSGSTVFGIAGSKEEAERSLGVLSGKYKWVRICETASSSLEMKGR